MRASFEHAVFVAIFLKSEVDNPGVSMNVSSDPSPGIVFVQNRRRLQPFLPEGLRLTFFSCRRRSVK
jgi:hypothetical protein